MKFKKDGHDRGWRCYTSDFIRDRDDERIEAVCTKEYGIDLWSVTFYSRTPVFDEDSGSFQGYHKRRILQTNSWRGSTVPGEPSGKKLVELYNRLKETVAA